MLVHPEAQLCGFKDFVCSLFDLVNPKLPNVIRLSGNPSIDDIDLKKCKCAPLFFDMLFDLRKYDTHVRRTDPLFREYDDVYEEGPDGIRIVKLEGFNKYATKEYRILAQKEQ
jgi:hypothetical protein